MAQVMTVVNKSFKKASQLNTWEIKMIDKIGQMMKQILFHT